MALAAVKDGAQDAPKILALSQRLARTQVKQGENAGGWSYATSDFPGERSSDRSNAQFVLDPAATELWGVDVAGRTNIIYSPNDLGCLWGKLNVVEPPNRTPQMKTMITKATQVGVNIVTYATGKNPPGPLEEHPLKPIQN
jgi:hypothetical protein